jgi:hypothetical protein
VSERRTHVEPTDRDRRTGKDRREDLSSRERVEALEFRYRRALGRMWAALVIGLFAVTVSLVGLYAQSNDLKVEQEARQEDTAARVDQSCTLAEQKQKDDVRQLRDTYGYLARHRHSLDRGLAKEVIRALPETERRAQQDDAPPYCDEPNVGLPEPDPVIPSRPTFLRVPLPRTPAALHPHG